MWVGWGGEEEKKEEGKGDDLWGAWGDEQKKEEGRGGMEEKKEGGGEGGGEGIEGEKGGKSVWVSKWGFGATKETELSVDVGEEVEVLDPSNPDWWYVKSLKTG